MAGCIMPPEIINLRLLGGRVESTKQIMGPYPALC